MSPRSAHFDMMREIQQQIGAPRLEVMEADHEAVIHALVAAGVASACCARNWPRWARRAVN